MITNVPDLALPMIVGGCAVAGFLFGKLHERSLWSALIRDGLLPPPKSVKYHNTPDNPFTHGQRIGPITPRDTP